MREMLATEASRNFSAVLDEAERGETIVVSRGGEHGAFIAPAPRANGAVVREVFERCAVDEPERDHRHRQRRGSRGGCG